MVMREMRKNGSLELATESVGGKREETSSSDLFVGQVFPIQSESKKDRTTFLGQELIQKKIHSYNHVRSSMIRDMRRREKEREREREESESCLRRKEEESESVFLHLFSFSRFNFCPNGS